MSRKTPAEVVAALDRSPLRRFSRAIGWCAERLAGREGPSRIPHMLSWRLRGLIWKAVPHIEVHGTSRSTGNGPRLLLVTHDLSRSGAPQILVQIAELLRGKDMEVVVFSPHDGPYRQALCDLGAMVIVWPGTEQAGLTLVDELGKAADAAICNTLLTDRAVKILSSVVPTVWYLHELEEIRTRLVNGSIVDAMRCAQRIWVVSNTAKSIVSGVRPDAQVISLGLKPLVDNLETRVDQPECRLRLGVFGSIEPRKGHDLLLDAIDLLSSEIRSQILIVIHGRTLDHDFFDTIAERAGGFPEVIIGEPLDQEGYRSALLACDGVIIPSRDESFSIVAADALGAGRVVLCSRQIGIAELLDDGRSGFVAASAEPEALARMITTAVRLRADWPIVARAGRTQFDAQISHDVFNDKISDEVDRMLRAD